MGSAALGMGARQGMMGLVVLLKFQRASSSPGFEFSRPARRQARSCRKGIPGCDGGASLEKPSGALRVGKAGGLQAETGNWRQGGGEDAKWPGCPPGGACPAAWADGGREDAARAHACKDARMPGRVVAMATARAALRLSRSHVPRSNAPMASRAAELGRGRENVLYKAPPPSHPKPSRIGGERLRARPRRALIGPAADSL